MPSQMTCWIRDVIVKTQINSVFLLYGIGHECKSRSVLDWHAGKLCMSRIQVSRRFDLVYFDLLTLKETWSYLPWNGVIHFCG